MRSGRAEGARPHAKLPVPALQASRQVPGGDDADRSSEDQQDGVVPPSPPVLVMDPGVERLRDDLQAETDPEDLPAPCAPGERSCCQEYGDEVDHGLVSPPLRGIL